MKVEQANAGVNDLGRSILAHVADAVQHTGIDTVCARRKLTSYYFQTDFLKPNDLRHERKSSFLYNTNVPGAGRAQ